MKAILLCSALLLLISLPCAAQSETNATPGQTSSLSCEASRGTRAALDSLREPQDAKLSAKEIKDKQVSLLRSALKTSPNDLFLLMKYEDLEIGGHGFGRSEAIKEFEALLKQHPDDPLYLYLAARAQLSRNTKLAIDYLQQAIIKAPQFAWPRLLLAEIYQSKVFNTAKSNFENRRKSICPTNAFHFGSLSDCRLQG